MNLICKFIGHRLETASHAKKATLWCARCKRVVWFLHEPSGLILHSEWTAADLHKLGLRKLEEISAPHKPTEQS